MGVAALLGAVPAVSFAFDYDITDLGAIGDRSRAYGISNAGHIVGVTGPIGEPTGDRAFIWQSGVMTQLGSVANYPASYGYAVNSAGYVAGEARRYSIPPQGTPASVRWAPDGTAQNLMDSAQAFGINEAGDVVGVGGGSATLWRNDGTINLGGNTLRANDINNVGQAIGYGSSFSSFLWQDGALTAVPLRFAKAINDSGVIIGSTAIGPAKWSDGNTVQLPSLGPADIANDINGAGVIVGGTGSILTGGAVIWGASGVTALNDLIPQNSGWQLWEARGINDGGSIVGWGYHDGIERGFLLTPTVPEQSGIVILASIVAGSFVMRKPQTATG